MTESSGSLTVPGNLLLAGEYAVLEEGGLGIAFAVSPRLSATIAPWPRLQFHGRWQGFDLAWSPGEGGSASPFPAVVAAVDRELTARGRPMPSGSATARIDIDSSAYFDRAGTKLGYGSSAATVVAATTALLRVAGIGEAEILSAVFAAAVSAHRTFQGGRGSGYDVAASTFGGVGLFTGGRRPTYRSIVLPWINEGFLVRGPSSVRTPDAVARYESWKEREPAAARSFLDRSNEAVMELARAPTLEGALPLLLRAAEVGRQLGASIGVPAELHDRTLNQGGSAKALGAGNELAIIVGAKQSVRDAVPVALERLGIVWRD